MAMSNKRHVSSEAFIRLHRMFIRLHINSMQLGAKLGVMEHTFHVCLFLRHLQTSSSINYRKALFKQRKIVACNKTHVLSNKQLLPRLFSLMLCARPPAEKIPGYCLVTCLPETGR